MPLVTPWPVGLALMLMQTPADPATSAIHPAKFEIRVAPGLLDGPTDGRLFLVFGKPGRPSPIGSMTATGLDANPILARDVNDFGPETPAVVDGSAIAFPIARLADLPPGDYRVQAVFDFHRDLRSPTASGNLISNPIDVRFDPAGREAIRLTLDDRRPAELLPADRPNLKFLKFESKLLSEFHGRPISLRASVKLPVGFDDEPERRYPLRVRIGGFGSRFNHVRPEPEPADAPKFLTLMLDGAGPLGDPYQVNSANHGPYGDAVVKELIPHVEQTFRGLGGGKHRVVDGGSTGGWVSLALQVFYPDEFAGCWSGFPDGVDFRAFQLVNIYRDANAYVNANGFERPACRERDGDVKYTMRHEVGLENVLGRGDSWTLSGGQWGSWNATYSPRGGDGRPVPLWDPKTGVIDRDVAKHWEKYDLRLVLERNWSELGPKLKGKIHIWVGEADEFFLNNAVHMLDDFLKQANPPAEATVEFGPGQGHGWMGISPREMLDQMAIATESPR